MADQIGLERYEALVTAHFGDKVKGKANRYTSMNGNMYSFLDKDGTICLRLSEAGKEAFNTANGTSDVIQYGAVMRGYVAVPEAFYDDEERLSAVFGECLENARTLPAKPTKKR